MIKDLHFVIRFYNKHHIDSTSSSVIDANERRINVFLIFICYLSPGFKLSGFVTAASHQKIKRKESQGKNIYKGFEEAQLKFYQEEARETNHKEL
jgi:hypothetical protein